MGAKARERVEKDSKERWKRVIRKGYHGKEAWEQQ